MRWWRHVFSPSARRLFPPAAMDRIAAAIAAGERTHGGQVMLAIEQDLPPSALWRRTTPRERALQAFARLGTWDTEHNNGVLIYLLLADHAIEIVADRGAATRVEAARWQAICRHMEALLRQGQAEQAALDGVAAVSALLAEHFPPPEEGHPRDALPDRPQLLG
ncbi:TPM domain-containing protein [Xanthomonas massiliensis]|jgi:uncharacterized membrane protein|uniref:TPM domain-containing protein n=1 Tax=Xanthomonas massiliensis TaxID=1720302 RepID=UPI00098F9A3B|nr:TPM domain-containing protein [Xanthomonas massiliensis]